MHTCVSGPKPSAVLPSVRRPVCGTQTSHSSASVSSVYRFCAFVIARIPALDFVSYWYRQVGRPEDLVTLPSAAELSLQQINVDLLTRQHHKCGRV